MLARVVETLVEWPDLAEDVLANEDRVELDQLDLLPLEVRAHVGERLVLMAVLLLEAARAVFFLDVRDAARHVNAAVLGLSDAVERPDDPRAGFVRALHERAQPVRRDDDIVVDEDDVVGVRLSGAEIARLVRRQELTRPHEPESALHGRLFEVARDRLGRAAVHVDELERVGRVLVEALQRGPGAVRNRGSPRGSRGGS